MFADVAAVETPSIADRKQLCGSRGSLKIKSRMKF
jgi:hypothetical protein